MGVAPHAVVSLELRPEQLRARRRAHGEVHVRNDGDAAAEVDLTATIAAAVAAGSSPRAASPAGPDVPATGLRSEFTRGGLRSRRGRSDARHHLIDPVVVAGPWIAVAGAAVVGVRRLTRR